MAYEFRLPDIGEGLQEAEILQWFVEVGQEVTADERVAEIQTDKVAVEVSTPVGGTVLSQCGPAGTILQVGDVLIELDNSMRLNNSMNACVETGDSSAGKEFLEKTEFYRVEEPGKGGFNQEEGTGTEQFAVEKTGSFVPASPAVRKLARDLGIDLAAVRPSGVNERITRADVKRAAAKSAAAKALPAQSDAAVQVPAAPVSESPRISRESAAGSVTSENMISGNMAAQRREPIRGVRKRIYENMTKSMYTAPQTTGMDDLDATKLVAFRQRLLPFAQIRGFKLTYLPVIIKAVTQILQEYPIFNATVDDERMEIVYRQGIHVGVATAAPEGLLVPVIRDADKLSLFQLAKKLEDLTNRARTRALKLRELTGGTFTISSTGARGGWFATPIVNYPEVAILGVHSIAKRAVVLEDGSIAAQERMSFSLTFDHRVIDGEPAGLFMERFREYMENPEVLLAL